MWELLLYIVLYYCHTFSNSQPNHTATVHHLFFSLIIHGSLYITLYITHYFCISWRPVKVWTNVFLTDTFLNGSEIMTLCWVKNTWEQMPWKQNMMARFAFLMEYRFNKTCLICFCLILWISVFLNKLTQCDLVFNTCI